jgi:aerobic-type carbon monoxide dehydrogenase small subunit (CoxS/CutS family)
MPPLDVLRNHLGLSGTRFGCGLEQCGIVSATLVSVGCSLASVILKASTSETLCLRAKN